MCVLSFGVNCKHNIINQINSLTHYIVCNIDFSVHTLVFLLGDISLVGEEEEKDRVGTFSTK